MGAVGNYQILEQSETYTADSGDQTVTVDAPSGKVVLGVTWTAQGIAPENLNQPWPVNNYWVPSTDGTSVQVVLKDSSENLSYAIYLVCAEMGC